jgi:hypothetical protein
MIPPGESDMSTSSSLEIAGPLLAERAHIQNVWPARPTCELRRRVNAGGKKMGPRDVRGPLSIGCLAAPPQREADTAE